MSKIRRNNMHNPRLLVLSRTKEEKGKKPGKMGITQSKLSYGPSLLNKDGTLKSNKRQIEIDLGLCTYRRGKPSIEECFKLKAKDNPKGSPRNFNAPSIYSNSRVQLCTLNTGAKNSIQFLSFLSDNVISILLDSRATHSFIAKHITFQYSLLLSKPSSPVPLYTISTEKDPSQWITHSTKWDVKLPGFPIFNWDFLVTEATDTEDIISGYDFLLAWNLIIDWLRVTERSVDDAVSSDTVNLYLLEAPSSPNCSLLPSSPLPSSSATTIPLRSQQRTSSLLTTTSSIFTEDNILAEPRRSVSTIATTIPRQSVSTQVAFLNEQVSHHPPISCFWYNSCKKASETEDFVSEEPEIYSESNEERTAESLLGGMICGQKISMGSDIGPPPSPHSVIDQDFSPITTHSQDWMDVNNGFFEVRQYARPCAFCTRNNLVCCEATRPGSKKCEACQVVKGVCAFSETPVFSEGRKVWCNPTTKSYGFEHPIQDVPTDDFDSGRSVLKKVGVPTGGIPILSKGWVNHEGVERDQVGSSERSARSNLRRAKEAKANQSAKRPQRNPSKSVTKTRPNLDAVANGSSSEEDGDDEGNDDDEGIDKRGNMAETEDGEYRPPLDDTAPPSPRPTRRQPNPSRGESSIPSAGKNPVNQSTSLLRAPPVKSLKASTSRAVDPVDRGVTPGVDDLVPWIPEGSELESDGFTRDRRTAMGLLVETHYLLGQGIQELIGGSPGKRFMGLAAVSDQMELAMTRVIREMRGWFEHLESNGFVSYEAWDGSAGEGPAESDPAE
ncbi:hypothetical protein PPACK8108_LOCUS6301 [Phakopsora pachyrhizi]|uniref:Zn(2)-C6 fungal-type domain-containing protein n=1 Tax=Phakopsora pachyrhizi TaxID=170000 RepID=A0AAV0AQM4_PHAPC|nr:hypothetical protein PPACK8108_LOCUS6301 [Phakopsora pachyrhizi]